MDKKKQITISNTCDCNIHLSLRNIIAFGITPVIQTITTIIAASVANTDLFGNYAVDFLFILGNVFALAQHSSLYTAYTMILQNLSEESIELKEKDTQGVTFWESLIQLLQPVMHEKPYMYESFSIGCLHQVSRETYGVTIKQLSKENAKYYKGKKKIPMSNISYEYDDTSIQME